MDKKTNERREMQAARLAECLNTLNDEQRAEVDIVLKSMANSLHTETGNLKDDVNKYLNEMRYTSDRWCTLAHRPIIDLANGEVIYRPNWILRLKESMQKTTDSIIV